MASTIKQTNIKHKIDAFLLTTMICIITKQIIQIYLFIYIYYNHGNGKSIYKKQINKTKSKTKKEKKNTHARIKNKNNHVRKYRPTQTIPKKHELILHKCHHLKKKYTKSP